MKVLALRRVVLFLVLWSMPGLGQCTLPGTPSAGTIDTTFDAYTTQNGPGWTGADGTYSLPLPDGTNLWMWSDSYIGTVDPTTRSAQQLSLHGPQLAHDFESGHRVVDHGRLSSEDDFVFRPQEQERLVLARGWLSLAPSTGTYQIKIMLTEWTGLFKLVGHSVATLSWPSLSIVSITPVTGLDTSLTWGTKILPVGNYFYIYGTEGPRHKHQDSLHGTNDIYQQPNECVEVAVLECEPEEVAGRRIECHRHDRRGGSDTRVFGRCDELQRRDVLPDGGNGSAASCIPTVGRGDHLVFVFSAGPMDRTRPRFTPRQKRARTDARPAPWSLTTPRPTRNLPTRMAF